MATASRLQGVTRATDRVLWIFDRVMTITAVVSLFVIMVMVFLDAMLRYLFNSPLGITVELVTLYLMSSALFSVLSHTLRQGGHITIDVLAAMMPLRLYNIMIGIAMLASTVCVAIMSWEMGWFSYESWILNEYTTGIHAWPLWLSKGLVALSFTGLTLRMLQIGVMNLLAGLVDDAGVGIPIMHISNEAPEEEGV